MSNEPRVGATNHVGAEWPSIDTTSSTPFRSGFEEDDDLRSEFIRQLARRSLGSQQSTRQRPPASRQDARNGSIPRTLVRFWHDLSRVPADVQACLDSWDPLREEGVTFRLFGDDTAAAYIADRYGAEQVAAFARCDHPAMRSDYLRLCVILAEGGLYVDADDVLLNQGWRRAFRGDTLKLQPLCYDIPGATMVAATKAGLFDRPTPHRIYYMNNNPIAAPPGHPILRRALERSTRMLLDRTRVPEIQSTTGPGNLTAALAAHTREDLVAARRPDLDLLFDWETTAEPDWNLEYRNDDRNWRKRRNWDFNNDAGPAGDG